jgi:hypothetical protein
MRSKANLSAAGSGLAAAAEHRFQPEPDPLNI